MRKNGFTLVELIVVVVILMILFSLVMSAVRRAGEQAKKTQCAGNMKQIWSALTMYISTNNENYPEETGWASALYPNFLDDPNIFDCKGTRSEGDASSPEYQYTKPMPSTPSTVSVLDDTNHYFKGRGWVTLYKNGGIKVK